MRTPPPLTGAETDTNHGIEKGIGLPPLSQQNGHWVTHGGHKIFIYNRGTQQGQVRIPQESSQHLGKVPLEHAREGDLVTFRTPQMSEHHGIVTGHDRGVPIVDIRHHDPKKPRLASGVRIDDSSSVGHVIRAESRSNLDKSIASGMKKGKILAHDVRLVTFGDGTHGVLRGPKSFKLSFGANPLGEKWVHSVAKALGYSGRIIPDMSIDEKHQTSMQRFIENSTPYCDISKPFDRISRDVLDSSRGRDLGKLDYICCNNDRHGLNYIKDENGDPWGVDYEFGFTPKSGGDIEKEWDWVTDSDFARNLVDVEQDPHEWETIKKKLEPLEPMFNTTRVGRTSYEMMMKRVQTVIDTGKIDPKVVLESQEPSSNELADLENELEDDDDYKLVVPDTIKVFARPSNDTPDGHWVTLSNHHRVWVVNSQNRLQLHDSHSLLQHSMTLPQAAATSQTVPQRSGYIDPSSSTDFRDVRLTGSHGRTTVPRSSITSRVPITHQYPGHFIRPEDLEPRDIGVAVTFVDGSPLSGHVGEVTSVKPDHVGVHIVDGPGRDRDVTVRRRDLKDVVRGTTSEEHKAWEEAVESEIHDSWTSTGSDIAGSPVHRGDLVQVVGVTGHEYQFVGRDGRSRVQALRNRDGSLVFTDKPLLSVNPRTQPSIESPDETGSTPPTRPQFEDMDFDTPPPERPDDDDTIVVNHKGIEWEEISNKSLDLARDFLEKKDLTEEQFYDFIAECVGIPKGSNVRVSSTYASSLKVSVHNKQVREWDVSIDGWDGDTGEPSLSLHYDLVRSNPSYRPVGRSEDSFGINTILQSVRGCRKWGIPKIIISTAAGSADLLRGRKTDLSRDWTGFKVWPRFFFDCEIPEHWHDDHLRGTPLEHCKTMMELYASPGGRKIWEESGISLENMTFDTAEDSLQSRMLSRYEKLVKRTPKAHENRTEKRAQQDDQSASSRDEKALKRREDNSTESPEITRRDERVLDHVWDEFSREIRSKIPSDLQTTR